jgi:hypothetical protein
MPNVDSSDYTRRRKLAIVKNANDAGTQTKFRALTVFDSYNPALVNTTGIVCNDSCRTNAKANNTFVASKYSASKIRHFN